jgi:aminocarboxymuconate-semialdehyde decarboxylase
MVTVRIDVHAHAFSEEFLRSLARFHADEVKLGVGAADRLVAYWAGAPLPGVDVEERVAEQERDGVRLEVLSAPVVYGWLDQHTHELCAQLNDYQSLLATQYPGRFSSFLHLPVHDAVLARRELDRWQGKDEVAGVVFASNMAGMYPGDRKLDAIWREIAERDLAVFIHPISPTACFGPVAPPVLLFPCDTAVAAASMIFAGLFERHPNLRVILSHYGGVLPMLARRLDMGVEVKGFPRGHGQDLVERPSVTVGRFWVDMAQGYHAPAFACARDVFGLEHMLYGSDHFFPQSTWRRQLNAFIEELDLGEEQRAALLSGNARRALAGRGLTA